MLHLKGKARLEYGNCHNEGSVKVSLNNTEIPNSLAELNTTKSIEFDFDDGNQLEIQEANMGVIMINSFEILNCTLEETNEGNISILNKIDLK